MVRVMMQLVADAQLVIDQPGSDRDEDLHQVRLVIKRLRSYLRLFKPVMEEAIVFRLNRRLRAAARRLSALRDTSVAQRMLEAWVRRVRRPPQRRALQAVLETLARQLTHAHPMGSGREAVLRRVGAELQAIGAELASHRLSAEGWDALQPGLNQTYRRGRRGMRRSLKSNQDEDYHEWRKHTKDLYYHLQLLEGAWPDSIRKTGRRLASLQDMIGLDHDLTVVSGLLREDPVFRKDADLMRVRKGMAAENRKLRKRIEKKGRNLFDESSRKFTRRLRKHWARWREDGGREPAHE